MRRLSIAILLAIVLVISLVVSCTSGKTSTPTPVPTQTQTQTQTSAPAAAKTLKIGLITNLESPLDLPFAQGSQAMADLINKNGGMVIGGDTYNIQLIVYDSKGDGATAKTAAQRLISEDNVKFILGDETADSWIPLTEASKVININCDVTNNIFDTKNHYTFQGNVANTEAAELWGWFTQNYPNLKTMVSAYPDNEIGHSYGGLVKKSAAAFGLNLIDEEYYPPTTTDFSSLGAKVKNLNPDCFLAQYGGPISDSNAFKAAYEAGWKGQQFASSTLPTDVLVSIVPPEAVEGMVCLAWADEIEPLAGAAKVFVDAYTAKSGKWDWPELVQLNSWYVLMGALTQANSLDTDKVASVLASGMKYESPCFVGQGEMVSRPDLGNSRTVDNMGGLAIKKIVGGKTQIVHVISLDEAYSYNQKFWGWK